MMIEVTPDEAEILRILVARELSELGPEIRHTSDRDYREQLKERKHEMHDLLEHLRAAQPA